MVILELSLKKQSEGVGMGLHELRIRLSFGCLKMEINFGILQKEAISSYLPRKYPVPGNKFYVHIYIYKREFWGGKISEDSLSFRLVYFKVLSTHPRLN
jgi:hypothetical protein